MDELLRVPIDTLRKEEYGEENTNEYPTGHLATNTKRATPLCAQLDGGLTHLSDHGLGRLASRQRQDQAGGRSHPSGQARWHGPEGRVLQHPDCTGEPVLTRTDPLVFFYWFAKKGGWPKGINPQSFSCRWTGQLEVPTTELYRFVWESYAPWRGDGWGTPGRHRWLKLWVGGNLILDTGAGLYRETTFGLPQPQAVCAEVPLKAGERYDLRLEAGFATNAVARFCWESPGLDRRAVLRSSFIPSPARNSGWKRRRHEVIADFGFEEKRGVLSWSKAGGDVFGRLTGYQPARAWKERPRRDRVGGQRRVRARPVSHRRGASAARLQLCHRLLVQDRREGRGALRRQALLQLQQPLEQPHRLAGSWQSAVPAPRRPGPRNTRRLQRR